MMVKPVKKRDVPQNDDKQTKISSFFGNEPNKKEESKLFTKISTVPSQTAGQLTLARSRNTKAVNSAKCISKTGSVNQIRQNVKKKKMTCPENTVPDDVIFIDVEEESMSCTDVKLKNTDIVLSDGETDRLMANQGDNFSTDEANKNNEIFECGKKQKSDLPFAEQMLNKLNSKENYQNSEPGNHSIAGNRVNSSGCSRMFQIKEGTSNEICENSETLFVTPTKQAITLDHCASLESSPDIICETPNVDKIFQEAAVRRKGVSSRSFLCSKELLEVQPGLKPAHLRMNQRKGRRKLIGNVSVTITSTKSESMRSSSDDAKFGQSSTSVVNTVTVSADISNCKNDNKICPNMLLKNQISLDNSKPFQENCPNRNNMNVVKKEHEMSQNGEVCIPESQPYDTMKDLEEKIDENCRQKGKTTVPISKHNEKRRLLRRKECIELFLNEIEDNDFDVRSLKPLQRTHSESSHSNLLVQKAPDTTTGDGFDKSENNMFASKVGDLQVTKPGSYSTSSIEIAKSTSKLINALEEADSRKEMTEERKWMEQRLMKHFSADFLHGSVDNVEKPQQQDSVTTPVKIYGESKLVIKRSAKSGLSPLSKRQLSRGFTGLKDTMQTDEDTTNKEHYMLSDSINKAKKTLCLENIVPSHEIQPNKCKLTEHRAYQFGLKKRGIHETSDMMVTLENDKLLSELLGQLQSPSKAEQKSKTLKGLNSPLRPAIISNTKEEATSKCSKDNVEFVRNNLAQKPNNKNGVLQSDIKMLDLLFEKDTLDGQDLEVCEKQTEIRIGDVNSSYMNTVVQCQDTLPQENSIIILDNTQDMDVVENEYIIIEDTCIDSVSNSKMPELHEISETKEDMEKIAQDSVAMEICIMETQYDNSCSDKDESCSVSSKSLNCNANADDISASNQAQSEHSTEHSISISVPHVIPSHSTYLTSINNSHRSITASTEHSHVEDSILVGIHNTNNHTNTAEEIIQVSATSITSVIPNTSTGKYEGLKHTNKETPLATTVSYNGDGIHISSQVLNEGFVPVNNNPNINIEIDNENLTEDRTAVNVTRNSTSIGCGNSRSSSPSNGLMGDTELSNSVCDMMCDSFDENFQDFMAPEISEKDFRFTDLWKRFIVLDVTHNRDETHLQLLCEKTRQVCQCILREFWTDTNISKDDVVNIVGGNFNDDVHIIDDKNGLIIVNPDLLLSGTLVVSSTFCARKSVLNEKFKGIDSGNLQMLYGSIIHSLFQTVLKDHIRDERTIMQAAKLLLKSNKFLHEMYGRNVQEASVMEEIGQYIPTLTSWMDKHTEPSGRAHIQKVKADLIVTEIHDIEENIWSPRFGLKGKLDVTIKAKLRKSNGHEEVKILPLELKTGKASFSPEHKGQVTLYSMMCSDRREDPGEGVLLYLKHGEMETVPVKPQNKCGLIQLRNNLAYYLTQEVNHMRSTDDQVIYQLGKLPKPINNQRACTTCAHLLNCSIYQRKQGDIVYQENHVMKTLIPETLQHLAESDLNYFTHWMLCLDMEGQESNKMHTSQIWRASSLEREKSGECLSNMMIVSSELDIPESQCYTEGRGCSLTFSRDHSHQGTALTDVGLVKNDMVVISSEDGRYIALATGFVRRILHNLIEVVVDRDNLHDTSSYANMRFRLDKNDSFSTSRYLCTNMSRLMEPNPRATCLRSLIISLRPPEFDLKLSKACIQKVKTVFKPLNKQQRTAILKVLMSKDYVLIKGFPGTGKTATIVALVKILCLTKQTVLLTSYTHSAVDNILLKLKEDGIPFLRLGRRSSIHPLIVSHSAEEVLTSSTTINSVQDLKRFYDSYDVIATSALGVNHPIFNHRKFDVCIVDEASQVLQPACLGPLFHCHKFVLVGDPKQLPPVVKSREARNLGLDESLFTRLENNGATYDLCLQYRMNRVIMELSNFLVYDGKLQYGNMAVAEQCCKIDQSHILDAPTWMKDLLSSDLDKSIVFLDTQLIHAVEISSGKGVTNEVEADLVMAILKAIVKGNVAGYDVGVISPYRSQVKLIKQKVHDCDMTDVEVNTVDQYQGRDKSIIIISFVRTHDDNAGELLKDLRRLNVALTRARHKLILIGNAKALKIYEHMAKILNRLEETKNIIQITEL